MEKKISIKKMQEHRQAAREEQRKGPQDKKKRSGAFGAQGAFRGQKAKKNAGAGIEERITEAGAAIRERTEKALRAKEGRRKNDREPFSRERGERAERKERTGRFEKKERTERAERTEQTDFSFNSEQIGADESRIEGRNAVTEAFRSGRTVDRLYLLEGCQDGAVLTIKRMAAKAGTPIKYLSRQRLDQMSATGSHQGVIAVLAAYHYAEMEDLFARARERGEDPFFIILDNIEDPHNLGAIIRTANVAGAHGVIIPKDRACGLTAVVAKASAGAINYTPVVKVTNIASTIEELKERGLWFVCADMDGTPMTRLNLTGPIGLVIGAEGNGVSRLVRERCDTIASIPMRGEINSLNASVAAGVLMYEIVRQRLG